MSLSFDQFVRLLEQPPFEPCQSELEFLTPAEYERAFVETVRLYQRRIIYYVAGITGDFANAPDIAQEVFLNVYRARSSFEKAYIYRAAKNTALKAIHHTKRRRVVESRWAGIHPRGRFKDSEPPDARPLPDAELIERIREEALRRAVERLPEHFRVPLLLRAEGQSYRRIVEITRVNLGTVKSRLCRGKSILRRRLRAYL